MIAVIDVDGTLADTERDGHRVAFNEAFAAAGLDYRWSVPEYGDLLALTGGRRRIARYLQQQDLESRVTKVLPLTGDASDRRYYRVLPRNGDPFVLAVYSAPFDPQTLPFVNTAELFAALPVPVPRILGHAADVGAAGVVGARGPGIASRERHQRYQRGETSVKRHARHGTATRTFASTRRQLLRFISSKAPSRRAEWVNAGRRPSSLRSLTRFLPQRGSACERCLSTAQR